MKRSATANNVENVEVPCLELHWLSLTRAVIACSVQRASMLYTVYALCTFTIRTHDISQRRGEDRWRLTRQDQRDPKTEVRLSRLWSGDPRPGRFGSLQGLFFGPLDRHKARRTAAGRAAALVALAAPSQAKKATKCATAKASLKALCHTSHTLSTGTRC